MALEQATLNKIETLGGKCELKDKAYPFHYCTQLLDPLDYTRFGLIDDNRYYISVGSETVTWFPMSDEKLRQFQPNRHKELVVWFDMLIGRYPVTGRKRIFPGRNVEIQF